MTRSLCHRYFGSGAVCRIIAAIFALMLIGSFLPSSSIAQEAPEDLQINSKRYIVIDANTGYVYAQKGAQDQVPIASLTKVFTASLAMDMAPLDTEIITKDIDLRDPDGNYFGFEGTTMGFDEGETYTLEDMLYGMMLPSGNDAALAIARTLGMQDGMSDEQAIQHFIDLMNQRATDLGLKNTHFMNPHGWGVDDHYSSAWDVATFTLYAQHNQTLMDIMATRSYTTSNGFLTVTNTNRALSEYDSFIAGKTGFDDDAGYCLDNIGGRDGEEMIAVTLDGIAPGDWYDDNRLLIEYGLQQKAELLDNGGSFEGDVSSFVDPSAVEVARTSTSGSSIIATGSGPVVAETPQQVVPPPAPTNNTPTVPVLASIDQPAKWAFIGAAGLLIALRGVISVRETGLNLRQIDFPRRSRII